MAEDLLVQKVVDGKINKTATETTAEETNKRGTSKLGKDAFLQLLVAEMQNQDPLEPSSNTEWVSQLATFSQLEELQTLSSAASNSQVFSLVGKQVVVTTDSDNGGKITKSGMVDYVTYSGGEAKFSVDGSLYSMKELSSVIGEDYYYEQNKPGMEKKGEKYVFDGNAPQDITFEVDMGYDTAKAENVALMVGKTVLPSDYVKVNDNTVTIKQELLQELEAGTYSIDVVFDDKNYTTIKEALSVTVFNPHPKLKEEEVEEEKVIVEEEEDEPEVIEEEEETEETGTEPESGTEEG